MFRKNIGILSYTSIIINPILIEANVDEALRVSLQLLELNTLDFLSMALGVRRHGKFVDSGYEAYFIWVCRYTGTLHDLLHPLPSVTTVFSVRDISTL